MWMQTAGCDDACYRSFVVHTHHQVWKCYCPAHMATTCDQRSYSSKPMHEFLKSNAGKRLTDISQGKTSL